MTLILSVFLCLFTACSGLDYMLQKPVKLDPGRVDSLLMVVVRDDKIVKEGSFPKIYLFVYVDDHLVIKSRKGLMADDRHGEEFYGSFRESIRVRRGKLRVSVIYRTYRGNRPVDFKFEEVIQFLPGKPVEIRFYKEFKLVLP